MAAGAGPKVGFVYGYADGDDGWGLSAFNPNFKLLEFSLQTSVAGTATEPPDSPAAGDQYIIIATATGAFSGKEDQIASYDGTAWFYITPGFGWRVYRQDLDAFWYYPFVWTPEPKPIDDVVSTQSSTFYSLVAGDKGKKLVFTNSSDIELDVPSGLGDHFDVVIIQAGTGQVTLSPGGGVTIHSRLSYTKTAGQWAVMSLIATASNVLVIAGDGA